MAIDPKTQEVLNFLAENNDGGEKKNPYNRTTQYSCGHKIEFYEEKVEEHIQIRHGTTGSYIKMYPTGDIGLLRALSLNYKTSYPPSKRFLDKISNLHLGYRTVLTWYMWRSIDPTDVEY